MRTYNVGIHNDTTGPMYEKMKRDGQRKVSSRHVQLCTRACVLIKPVHYNKTGPKYEKGWATKSFFRIKGLRCVMCAIVCV